MDSFIIDEVDELLKLKKGESNRLNQIKQLCEAKKLIPISDRKYVERLASQYLYTKEEVKIKDQNFQNIQSEQNMTHENLPKNEKEIVTNKETAQIIEEPVPSSITEISEKSSLFILISNGYHFLTILYLPHHLYPPLDCCDAQLTHYDIL